MKFLLGITLILFLFSCGKSEKQSIEVKVPTVETPNLDIGKYLPTADPINTELGFFKITDSKTPEFLKQAAESVFEIRIYFCFY